MNPISIGILGGMGPRATIEFESRLVAKFTGQDQAAPRIISVNNSQIPDRSSFLVSNSTDPGQELIYSARILKSAKVDIVCMPCNTAHSPKILARLMANCPLPIIDMPAAAILKAEQMGLESVLILGTAGTAGSNIFDNRAVSVSCEYPTPPDQEIVSDIILAIKSGKSPGKDQMDSFNRLIADIQADAIILACTELSLISKDQIKASQIIDTLDVLVDQCVNICTQQITLR